MDSFRSKRRDRIEFLESRNRSQCVNDSNEKFPYRINSRRTFRLFFSIFFFFHPLHLRVSSGVDQLRWKEVSRTYSLKPAETKMCMLTSGFSVFSIHMVNWDNRIRGVVRLLGGSGQVVHQARITFLNGTKIARSGSQSKNLLP